LGGVWGDDSHTANAIGAIVSLSFVFAAAGVAAEDDSSSGVCGNVSYFVVVFVPCILWPGIVKRKRLSIVVRLNSNILSVGL
jgi:hypothetical protein